MKLLINILGWCGMGAILVAFGLLSYEIIESTGLLYQFINLAGASSLIIYSIYHRTYPVMVLNIIWGIIALTSIFRF